MTLWILDTDHISLYQRGDLNVINRLSAANPENLAVTVISLEEQMYGRLSEIKRATHCGDRFVCEWDSRYSQSKGFWQSAKSTSRKLGSLTNKGRNAIVLATPPKTIALPTLPKSDRILTKLFLHGDNLKFWHHK